LRGDLLNFIFSRFVQPSLPERELCFVYNYPMELASLARQYPGDRRLANRFEAFFNGIELCNGYEELTDMDEYAARFTAENRKRKAMGKPELPVDKKFLDSLKKGLPPCSGAALGLDRLLMLGMGTKRIEEVIDFPIDRC
jgi:lysyl-tRNA synthetase class 2